MDQRLLKEDRRHGTPQFPFAVYAMERLAEETILDNHWHDEAEFLWVHSGQAIFQIGLSTYEVHAGEAIFVPCGEVHGGMSDNGRPCEYRAVVFDLDWLADGKDLIASRYMKPLRSGEAAIPLFYGRSSEFGEPMIERLRGMYRLFESVSEAKELRIKAELYTLFAELIESGQWKRAESGRSVNSHTMDRLKAAVTYLETHCAEPLSIPVLAEIAGMSNGHFSRMFRIVMRKTPMDYLNRYRIRQAAYLLQNTDWPVAEVAMETGITNFSYFGKKFSAMYACTPSQYRKKFRSL